LEDYLDGFAGIVITVSHDRYFLDRIVDRIFAFEGGRLKQYEGGFSDYYEKSAQTFSGEADSVYLGEKGKKDTKEYKNIHTKTLKFSYKEQREYDSIDGEIAKLEDKIAELDEQIAAAATQYGRLNELTEEKMRVEEELEAKMERWVELNELAEKIANQ
jgi:ATP-binding cassette subfamily F protein uup